MAEHNTPSTQARDELGIELRSFYRTSPPAADRWVHRARYEVIFLASFFPCPFSAARAAVVRRASTRRLDPAARWPVTRTVNGTGHTGAGLRRACFGSPTRERPPRRHRRDPLQKTQAKRGDKAKQALAPALKFKAVDEKAFDKLARNVERLAAGSVATTEFVARVF